MPVSGQAQLRALSFRLDKADEYLAQENAKALRRSAPKIARSVDRSALKRLPTRGGLSRTVVVSMRFDVKISRRGMFMAIWARGKTENRDLPAFNRGIVRHPVWGNRQVWRVTHIRPRFVSDPLDHEAPRILEREVRKGVDNTAHFIEGT